MDLNINMSELLETIAELRSATEYIGVYLTDGNQSIKTGESNGQVNEKLGLYLDTYFENIELIQTILNNYTNLIAMVGADYEALDKELAMLLAN